MNKSESEADGELLLARIPRGVNTLLQGLETAPASFIIAVR